MWEPDPQTTELYEKIVIEYGWEVAETVWLTQHPDDGDIPCFCEECRERMKL